MNVLDVFSGSQSLRREFINNGHQVTSIDIKKYRNSSPDTLIMNFLDFDFKVYSPGHFDILFFGLPCDAFSKASGGYHFTRSHEPKTEFANISIELLNKTFECLSYFNDAIFYIENPSGGLCNYPLVKQSLLDSKMFLYRFFMSQFGFCTPKQTDIFTNNTQLVIFDKFYRKNGIYQKQKFDRLSLNQKHSYPIDFCKFICKWSDMYFSHQDT